MAAQTRILSWHEVAVVCGLVAGVGLAVWLFPSKVQARDGDGSRLGAKKHELGTTQQDSLKPPDDAVDWRYFKVEEATTVTASIEVEPADHSTNLTLTRATGDELETAQTEEGEAQLERELEPGLYYLKVGASASISYSLTIE